VHAALLETLHTATLGTVLAVLIASLGRASWVARNITPLGCAQRKSDASSFVATRSVHARGLGAVLRGGVFGPGALAGTLAIAVHSIGFTGKFLSEAIEEVKSGPIEALTAGRRPRRLPSCSRAIGHRSRPRVPGDRDVSLGHQRA